MLKAMQTARPSDRLNGFENNKTQLFNSWGVLSVQSEHEMTKTFVCILVISQVYFTGCFYSTMTSYMSTDQGNFGFSVHDPFNV